MRPDRVVIGADPKKASDVLAQLYRPLYLMETPILYTKIETAELIKYAANTFLAAKITFINEIANLCEKVGADVQEVARGIGLDGRIGSKFLHAGPGYGGSCFPKDTLALVRPRGISVHRCGLSRRSFRSMKNASTRWPTRSSMHCGGAVDGKTIAVLGVTFKPNTDDMRDSPSLAIVPALQNAGAPSFARSTRKEWKKREKCCRARCSAKMPTRRWRARTRLPL